MRFIEEQPSNKDRNIMLPIFKMNIYELEILYALLLKAGVYIPISRETGPTVERIESMKKVIGKYMGSKNIKLKTQV